MMRYKKMQDGLLLLLLLLQEEREEIRVREVSDSDSGGRFKKGAKVSSGRSQANLSQAQVR
jgi:hypothetical protein